MKKILLFVLLCVCGFAYGQTPSGYTKINARYKWTAGIMDSGFHVPQYNGVPSGTRTGVWAGDGAIAVDTLNHYFYIFSGGAWVKIAKFSDIPAAIDTANKWVNNISRTSGVDSIYFNIGGTRYAIKDSSGGAAEIYNESVVKVSDSVYLEGEKTYTPSANTVYGRNNSNAPGYHAAAIINLTNIENKHFLNYKTGEWINTKYFQEMRFLAGDSNYVSTGDSTITDTAFYSRKLNIFREGELQYLDDTLSGYEIITDSTIVFHPPLNLNERVIIQIYDTAQWNTITAGTYVAPEECVVFNVYFDLTESPACTWTSAASGGQGYSTKSLLNGTDGYFVITNTSTTLATANPIGLDDDASNAEAYTAWEYCVYRYASEYYYIDNGASVVNTFVAAADNDLVRLSKVGTTVKAQYSSDSGATWNDLHTFSVSGNHTLYAKTYIPVAGKQIQNAKIWGFQ